MKEYIVTKPVLNVRNSASVANDDNFIGQVNQGEILYLDPKTVTGDVPKGGTSDQWHPDLSNRVVASEGVSPYTFDEKVKKFLAVDTLKNLHQGTPTYQNWHVNWGFADQEIWKFWEDFGTKGKNITVAVIDLGVNDASNDLQGQISNKSLSLVGTNPGDFSDTSQNRHGTKSAGLIAASGDVSVSGIAPQCELIVIKAGVTAFTPEGLLPAMQKAISLGADIISMSIEYALSESRIAGMKAFLDGYKTQDKLFIGAVGDKGKSLMSYPASYAGCLSVGAYGLDGNNQRILNPKNTQNDQLAFLCPGTDLLTCSDNGSDKYNFSSAATAFAAGTMALIASALGRVPSYNEILAALATGQCTARISATSPRSPTEGYGVLSPYQLLKILKSNT